MAIKLSEKFPGRSNPPSVDYPLGSIKDQSAPGAKDGTPLKADWANDHEGFFQGLLKSANITANGNVDTSESSQYLDALKQIIEDESPAPSQATELSAGVAKIATQAKVDAGSDDQDFVTSKKLRFGVLLSLLDNGYIVFPTWLGGISFQWGVISGPISSTATGTFPLAFNNKCFSVLYGGKIANDAAQYNSISFYDITKTNFVFATGTSTSGAGIRWAAIGY